MGRARARKRRKAKCKGGGAAKEESVKRRKSLRIL